MDVRAALIAAEEHLEANLRATPTDALSAQQWRTNETMSIAASLFVLAKSTASSAGPCMAQGPTVSPAPIVSCELTAGHEGGHSSGGMSWTTPDIMRMGRTCGVRWSWPDGETSHYEICTLPAKHTGAHYNEVTRVESVPPAEPTKPIADRLHELVSNWTSGAESFEAFAHKDSAEAGSATALRMCAAELESLLMEGGI